MEISQLSAEQLGRNLSHPEGEAGIAVGEFMNRVNLSMSRRAYQCLAAHEGDRILEIGPGNGALISEIVSPDNRINYTGLDISTTMIDRANSANAELVREGRVKLVLAPVERIPFDDDSFERAVTVNCIYFWDIPRALGELHRVLVPGGFLVVASNTPETMASLPFANDENGFKNIALDHDSLCDLHKAAGFRNVKIEEFSEPAKRLDGTPYMRNSYILVATK
jgi:ubiquinone/menaquinone biosynthesis C-methylase UbiE